MRIDVDIEFVKYLDKLRKDCKLSRSKAAKKLVKQINKGIKVKL